MLTYVMTADLLLWQQVAGVHQRYNEPRCQCSGWCHRVSAYWMLAEKKETFDHDGFLKHPSFYISGIKHDAVSKSKCQRKSGMFVLAKKL